MGKISRLHIMVVVTGICSLLMNCKVSAIDIPVEIYIENNAANRFTVKNDSLLSAYIDRESIDLDSLNSLLSHFNKKDKIDITKWKTIYRESGRIRYKSYIGYRLIVLYGLNFREIVGDWEDRLDFFIASVYNDDYEVLNLLDFKDDALDRNSCYGITVLTAAVRENNIKMVEYLLSCGIDKNKREFAACYDDSQEEQNAYEIAEELGYKYIMELLK